ncbi:MAG: RNase adapter RapZ [Burkholderiales bacterium]|jgi:UPF0042 nucleotide-binding protein|nr:RNase adapter RapZ [Burkholderiales bacterium]
MKDIFLIVGLSGSGKSVALSALEDAGFCAISNLPLSLLASTAEVLQKTDERPVAITLSISRNTDLSAFAAINGALARSGWNTHLIFLEAHTDTLVQRFSETRRRHPFSETNATLPEAIEAERALLSPARNNALVLDTSGFRSSALRAWIKQFVGVSASRILVLFESFGFKHGVPLDADLVFDVRCLPNPYYEEGLARLTGLDQPVIDFLSSHQSVAEMYDDIYQFVSKWLPKYIYDNRNYLTIAIGCTGGQHRSVYLVERLGALFQKDYQVIVRHRELSREAINSHL